MSDLQKHIDERLKDQSFQNAWEDSKLEYEVAKQIIALRKSSGVTQKELAQKLNTKQSAISRIEKGEQNISITQLEKIAVALGGDINISIEPTKKSVESPQNEMEGKITSQTVGGNANQIGDITNNLDGSSK